MWWRFRARAPQARGFTGHEHIRQFNIINMNARLYDPRIARFFSPDNFITDPENPQNYNRYSYALNNPLKYTDPTGNSAEWTEPFDGSTMISPPRRGGINLSILNGIFSSLCRMGSMSLIDYNKLDFALASGTFTSFTSEYLYSGGGDGGGGSGSSPADPEKKAKTKAGGGGNLPNSISFRSSINGFPFSSLSKSDKEKASKNYTTVVDKVNAAVDYTVPEEIIVVAASSEEIRNFSSTQRVKESDLVAGLSIYEMEVDGIMTAVMFISTEYLLQPEGIPGREFDKVSPGISFSPRPLDTWVQWTLEDVVVHEIGHFDGYCSYPGYSGLSSDSRENYANMYRNRVLVPLGRPEMEIHADFWEYGGWFYP